MSLSRDQVLSAFRQAGFSPGTRVDSGRLNELLSSWAGCRFDPQLYQEIVSQCKKADNQVEFYEFSGVVVEAYRILQSRIQETEASINNLERVLYQAERDSGQTAKANVIKNNLQQSEEQLATYKKQKQLLDKTFRHRNRLSQPGPPIGVSKGQAAEAEWDCGLRTLLVLTCLCAFFQLIMSFGKPQFIQLLSLVTILSIFVLKHYDFTHMRVAMALAAVAWVADLVWLINNVGRWFSPPQLSQLYAGNSGFYRYCVVMTFILQIVRVVLLYILFTHRNPESHSRKVVPLFADKVLQIGGQPSLLTNSLRGSR